MAFDPNVLGHLIEGTVEQDPMTDEFVIRTVDHRGKGQTFRINEALRSLLGKPVRFTLASIANIERIAAAIEGQQAQVVGAMPDGIPNYNVVRSQESGSGGD